MRSQLHWSVLWVPVLTMFWGVAVGAEVSHTTLDFQATLPAGKASRGILLDTGGLRLTDDSTQPKGVFESGAIAAPRPFTAAGPHWDATVPAGTRLQVEASISNDGVAWSPFYLIEADPHMVPESILPDGQPNPFFGHTVGSLIHRSRGDGQFLKFRITLSRDKGTVATPILRSLTVTFIDSRRPGPDAESATGQPGASTGEVRGGYPKPPVNSRGAWGAAPPTCTYSYCSVTHIAVHHTAGVGEYSCSGFNECAADVRAIQAYHMNVNGWCDVGYNYLSSSDGALWEGRGGGDDVRGAHDGYNCGSMAISNMGYYHPPYNHAWTEAQANGVAELAAWKANQKGIDPFGSGYYSGLGAVMDNVYGHRDVSSTACPGDTIYPRLAELRGRIADKLGGGNPGDLIFDNPSVFRLVGSWFTGTSSQDKYGSDYYWANTGWSNPAICIWRVEPPVAGNYQVSFWWPQGSNRNAATWLMVKGSGAPQFFTVNQQTNGGQWNTVTSLFLGAEPAILGVLNVGTSGSVVMCDAVRLTGP